LFRNYLKIDFFSIEFIRDRRFVKAMIYYVSNYLVKNGDKKINTYLSASGKGTKMILSGRKIKSEQGKSIIIEPFNEQQVGPNSYNLRLHSELVTYTGDTLDMKKNNPTEKRSIPPEGLLLEPGTLYLGRTLEYTKTTSFVPILEGRSSIGRLGLFIHVTAGFGDVGFAGFWTLEIFCVQPIRIYAGVEICQIYYHTIEGEYDLYKSKKYQNNKGIQSSMLYKDFGL